MIGMNGEQPTRQAHRTLARPRPTPRSWLRAIVLLAVLLAATISSSAQGDPHALAARALTVNDTAHVHYVKESGAQLVDEGAATGTLPGTVRVSFNVGATVAATFTIYTHGGSIVGHGSGTLHSSRSRSDMYVSFGGTMTVSHGTGRYAHARGTGGFYGTIDRTSYAATIQTTGTLSY
jgi:hypothetical protein